MSKSQQAQESVSKRKVGILLDELLAAHAAGDDLLADLRTRYGANVVPASAPKASMASKRPKTAAKEASQERVWLDRATPKVAPIAGPCRCLSKGPART